MKTHSQLPTEDRDNNLSQNVSIQINQNDLTESLNPQPTTWITEIEGQANLPSRFKLRSHHTSALLFALTCSALASFLYAEGGKKYGPYSEAGSIFVNLTQNIFYNILTYFFIMTPERSWPRLLPSIFFALLATTPSTISTYDLSEENRIEKTIFNALGNVFGNIFGMYAAFDTCISHFSNNKKARDFLRTQLQTHLQNNDENFKDLLETEHSKKTKIAGYLLGMTMGINLASSHTGYICSSSRYIEKLVGDQDASIALGLLSMMPNLTIALLLSGLNLGKMAVNDVADIFHYLKGDKKINLSSREKKLLSGLIIALGISSWMAIYSSATSKYLFTQKCDLESTFGTHVNEFLRFTTDKNAIGFNAIMSGIAIKSGFDYIKTAYAPADSTDRKKYKITAMDKWIQQAPIDKIESINKKYFPNHKSEWEKSPTCFSRLRNRFFKGDQTKYQTLDTAPINEAPTAII